MLQATTQLTIALHKQILWFEMGLIRPVPHPAASIVLFLFRGNSLLEGGSTFLFEFVPPIHTSKLSAASRPW
jgi:hypothetical protein